MIKKFTSKILLTLFTTFISFCATSQILHTESFDATTFLPTGWVTVGTAPDWTRQTTFTAPITGTPHSGAGMARMRFPTGGTGTVISEAISTPVFDLTGRGTNIVPVSFWIHRDSLMLANNDSISVYVNTTASLTGATLIGKVARNRSINVPDTKPINGWYQYTFNIPSNFNAASNFVIFKGSIYSTTPRRIYIDDINWTEYPPVCNSTPNGGTLATNTPIICSGSGTANLTLSSASVGTGISYDWFVSPNQTGPYTSIGVNALTTTTGTITSTQYYYAAVTCSGSGITSSSDTISVIVNPNPAPIVAITMANDTICRNDTLALYANGAATYQWSSTGTPNLGTLDSLLVAPQNTTTYNLIGYDTLGCASTSVSQTIVVGRRPTINAFNNSNPVICVGGNSILFVQATTGGAGGGVVLSYQWNPNVSTTNTATVAPTTNTLYTVTVIGQYGCFSTDTTNVIINTSLTSPSLSVSPDSLVICQGVSNTAQLVASSTSPNITYSWASTFGNPITSTNDTLNVNVGNQTLTYIVTGTDPTNGCNSSAVAVIYVRPVPNLNLSSISQTVCLNGSTVLNVNISNTQGTSSSLYNVAWTPSAGNLQTITVSPTVTGYYYVNVTSPYGCVRADSILITVDTTLISPTLNLQASQISLCNNALVSIDLVANTDAINPNFSWLPNQVSINNDSIVVAPTQNTTYSVSVTDQAGCTSSSSQLISIYPAPVANFTYNTSPNNDVNFVYSAGGNSYSWDFGDGSTSTQQNPTHSYPTAGTFTVTLIVTSPQGCSDTSNQIIQALVNGINDLSNNFEVTIFPNPTRSDIQIQLNSSTSKMDVSLFNILGERIILEHFLEVQIGKANTISLEKIPAGIYYLEISDGSQQMSKRIIKL